MKITAESLTKYGIDSYSYQFLLDNYPSGADFSELCNNSSIPLDLLHLIVRYLPTTGEEKEEYKKVCNVSKSKYVYDSTNILSSQSIVYSDNVKQSTYIYDSEYVNNSSDIYESQSINTSHDIYHSFSIVNSNKIIRSGQVNDSEQIYNSRLIEWSKNITNSKDIRNSSFLYNSRYATNCHFSGCLTDCNNCLFCLGLVEKQFHIFNKPVKPIEFEKTLELVNFWLLQERPDFIHTDNSDHNGATRYSGYTKLANLMEGLSEDFYGKIGTIKQYDESLFLNLFFAVAKEKNIKL